MISVSGNVSHLHMVVMVLINIHSRQTNSVKFLSVFLCEGLPQYSPSQQQEKINNR